jgi:hypothetical protein
MEFLAFMASLVLAIGAPGPGNAETNVITTVQQIARLPNPSSLAGRRVELSNLQVQQIVGPQVFLVSSAGQHLVVRRATAKPPFQPGQMVDVVGTINQLPAQTQRADLPGKDNQALKGQSIFINATTVRLHANSPGTAGTAGKRKPASGANAPVAPPS